MKKEQEESVCSQGGLKGTMETIEVADTATQESGLPVIDTEFCKDAIRKIKAVAPEHVFEVMTALSILDLNGIIKVGKIKLGRLVMNRWPKPKAVNSMAISIMENGVQIMLLVIPGTVAVKMGYAVEDFEGKPIPEDQLTRTVIIVNGQTRYMAIRKIMKEHPDKAPANVFAYFPTNWADLTKMLQAINLKVFTWKNSDFITGVIGLDSIKAETKAALKHVQALERLGYNYTAACEFITLHKGIIKKPGLVKAMNGTTEKLKFDDAKYGMEIHKAAQGKFAAKNEKVLMNKAVPEFVISKWSSVCNDLSKKEATAYMAAFFNSLSGDEVKEIVSPSGYKRGCGKFQANHPLDEFKNKTHQ